MAGAGAEGVSRHRDETVPVKVLGVRLKNRRVLGCLMKDGSILWKFKRLTHDRCVDLQRIRLSDQALAVMVIIAEKLKRGGA